MGILTDSTLMDTICFVITIIFLLLMIYTRDYQYWNRLGIFHLKPSFPFGNMYNQFYKRQARFMVLQDLYREIKAQNQPYGGFFYLNVPELLVVDPSLLKNVLISDFSSFQDRGSTNLDLEKEPMQRHLFSIDGHIWKPLRQKLSPTFTSGKMKFMFETMEACSKDLSTYLNTSLQESDSVDVKNMCECYTLDVIGSCAFGLDVHCLQEPECEFRQAASNIFKPSWSGIAKNFLLRVSPRVGQFFGLTQISPETAKFFTHLVTENIKYRETNNIKRQDFLNLLMDLKNKQTSDDSAGSELAMTMDLIVANVFLFFIAGFHTSSLAMSLCLVELAHNKEVQDKLREEILRVTMHHADRVTYESVKEMPYLDKIAKETLRKYPSLTQLNRRSTRPYPIPGTKDTLESRTRLIVPVYALHHDPEYYPNPEQFDPDRFDPEEVAKRPPFTYLPFGDGPRNCIGLRFGTLQFKLGIINVISKYEVLPPSEPEERSYQPDATLMMTKKVTLRARKLK